MSDQEQPLEYVYLVFYVHNDGKGGFGRTTISADGPISSREDVFALDRMIQRDTGLENVGVASYQLICSQPKKG